MYLFIVWNFSHDITGGVVGGTPRGRSYTHVFLRLLHKNWQFYLKHIQKFRFAKLYDRQKIGASNTHVFFFVGGNGGDVTRFISRGVDVHVEMAEGVEADLIVDSIGLRLTQPRPSTRLDLLNLGFNICIG